MATATGNIGWHCAATRTICTAFRPGQWVSFLQKNGDEAVSGLGGLGRLNLPPCLAMFATFYFGFLDCSVLVISDRERWRCCTVWIAEANSVSSPLPLVRPPPKLTHDCRDPREGHQHLL